MNFIKVGKWEYRGNSWHRGTYIVNRNGDGLVAKMKMNNRFIQIGTSMDGDVTGFLNRVDQFIYLKEDVYA